jgi:hypothetical protein
LTEIGVQFGLCPELVRRGDAFDPQLETIVSMWLKKRHTAI